MMLASVFHSDWLLLMFAKPPSKPKYCCKPSLRRWLFCVCFGFSFLMPPTPLGHAQTSCFYTAPVTLNGVCGKQILVCVLRSTSITMLACFPAAGSQTRPSFEGVAPFLSVSGNTSPDSYLSLTVF